jgi:hypothetical protein
MAEFQRTYGSPTPMKKKISAPKKTCGINHFHLPQGQPTTGSFTSDHFRRRNDELEATCRTLASKNHAIAKKLGLVEIALVEAKQTIKLLRHQVGDAEHKAARQLLEFDDTVVLLKSSIVTVLPVAPSMPVAPAPPSGRRPSTCPSPRLVGGRSLLASTPEDTSNLLSDKVLCDQLRVLPCYGGDSENQYGQGTPFSDASAIMSSVQSASIESRPPKQSNPIQPQSLYGEENLNSLVCSVYIDAPVVSCGKSLLRPPLSPHNVNTPQAPSDLMQKGRQRTPCHGPRQEMHSPSNDKENLPEMFVCGDEVETSGTRASFTSSDSGAIPPPRPPSTRRRSTSSIVPNVDDDNLSGPVSSESHISQEVLMESGLVGRSSRRTSLGPASYKVVFVSLCHQPCHSPIFHDIGAKPSR